MAGGRASGRCRELCHSLGAIASVTLGAGHLLKWRRMTPLPPPPPLSLSLSLSRHTHTQSSMIRLHCALAYRSHVPRHPDIVTNRRRYGDCCLCTRVDGVIAVQGRATHAQRSTCSAVVLCFIDAAIRRSRLRVMTVAAAVNITK